MTELNTGQSVTTDKPTRNPIKKLYHWVLSWADSRYGPWALFATAFAESSFFPVPPDVLLMPLCLGNKKKSFKFVLICTVGSVLGGALGYLIGYALYKPVAEPFIQWCGLTGEFEEVQSLYNQYAGLAVSAAALTPIPYKLFTIAAGLCHINFFVFLIASAIFRGLRFFIEGALVWKFGEKIRDFLERYFNYAMIAIFILIVVFFLVFKFPSSTQPGKPSPQPDAAEEAENAK